MTTHTKAATILAQLGGGRFVAMTGARQFTSSEDNETARLTFRLPRKANSINCVTIVLEASDLYTVIFCSITGLKVRVVDEVEGVYWDQLRDLFTARTGLYTSL